MKKFVECIIRENIQLWIYKVQKKLYASVQLNACTYIDNDGWRHLRGLVFPAMVAGYDGPRYIGRVRRVVLCRRPVDIISCALTISPVVVLHSYYIFTASHHETLHE